MELSGHRADFGVEQPFDEAVNVLVGRTDRGPVREFVGHTIETLEQLRFFAGAQNAGAAKRVHPRFAREDVLRPEPMIDGETAV